MTFRSDDDWPAAYFRARARFGPRRRFTVRHLVTAVLAFWVIVLIASATALLTNALHSFWSQTS